jgi:hypothetical protein
MLVLWAAGLAIAGALLGYAFLLPLAGTLFVSGLLLSGALWWGPGGSRVRGPVLRVVRPLADRPVIWLVAALLVAAVGTGAGALARDRGVDWVPSGQGPLAFR